jgi:hypothetical protein
MEYTLGMQITGAVLVLIAIMKNYDPVAFNKSIFGDVEGVEGGPAASMRMVIGGALGGIGVINLYCSFNVEDAAAGEAILVGTGIGLAFVFSTIVWSKFRGFLEEMPPVPMVVFPTLIVICLYSAMM